MSIFDLNGDGKVDYKDAEYAAAVTAAGVASAAAGASAAAAAGASVVAANATLVGVATATYVGGPILGLIEMGTGALAGTTMVKKLALDLAIAQGKVIVVGGIAMTPAAAIAAGVFTVVTIAGTAYYMYVGEDEVEISLEEAGTEEKPWWKIF